MSETERVRATIARLGARGDGLTEDGLAVPGALPGERVTVERDGSRGRLLAIETPSPERIAAFCSYYADGAADVAGPLSRSGEGARGVSREMSEAASGRCGGCAMQHLAAQPYAAWKRGIVAQALAQARVETELGPLVDAHGAGRRRITLHVREVGGVARAGLMAVRSHSLVPIGHCPITVPALHRAPAVAEALAAPLGAGCKPLDMQVTETETGLDVDIRGHGKVGPPARASLTRLAAELDLARLSLHGDVVVERRLPTLRTPGGRLLPPPGAFLQPTEAGERMLTGLVLQALDARARRVADLFAGSGPFTLALARAAEVHAVDGDAAALQALERAARATLGLRRVDTERRDLFRRPLLVPELDRFDAVVFDPPRAGAQAQVAWIGKSQVPLVVGVACDPGTFARDAATLVEAGYRLERVTPVDQFKYTAHVELVGVFRRSEPKRRRLGRA